MDTKTQRSDDGPEWLHFPQTISIETYALCNAACDFCPYVELERKNTRMEEDLIEKILSDIKSTGRQPQFFNLSRVNEPFLDKRIFDIATRIRGEFPESQFLWFSNGTPLNQLNIDKLIALEKNYRLNVSFNDHRAAEYEKSMQISYARTTSNLKLLHEMKSAGQIGFNINLSRVGDGTEIDAEFRAWCETNYPLFSSSVSPRFDWMGTVDTEVYTAVPDTGCAQWSKLHLLADGKDAFCCIDSGGRHGIGNARDQHVIDDLYNHPWRLAIRQKNPSRKVIRECHGCTACV